MKNIANQLSYLGVRCHGCQRSQPQPLVWTGEAGDECGEHGMEGLPGNIAKDLENILNQTPKLVGDEADWSTDRN